MKTFDMKRFCNVVKWELTYKRSKLVKSFLSCFVSYFLIMLFFNWAVSREEDFLRDIVSIFWTSLFTILIVSGSFIFRQTKTRQDRIDLFMMPASMLEKFSARYLLTVVGMLLIFIVGCFSADFLRYLLMLVVSPDRACLMGASVLASIPGLRFDLYAISLVFLLWWLHSVYLLGGVFFKKAGWLWTTLSIIFVFCGVVFGLGYLFVECMDALYPDGYNLVLIEGAKPWLQVAYFVVMGGLTVFNYWLSFRIFKRMQIINNRWFN